MVSHHFHKRRRSTRSENKRRRRSRQKKKKSEPTQDAPLQEDSEGGRSVDEDVERHVVTDSPSEVLPVVVDTNDDTKSIDVLLERIRLGTEEPEVGSRAIFTQCLRVLAALRRDPADRKFAEDLWEILLYHAHSAQINGPCKTYRLFLRVLRTAQDRLVEGPPRAQHHHRHVLEPAMLESALVSSSLLF